MKERDPEEFVEQQKTGDFTSILANFYRGEVQRSYTWRTRLDRTTNWAILILSVLITWVFSSPDRPHELLLYSFIFMFILMFIEARRYRFYNVWASRIRVIEKNFIAKALNPKESVSSRDWMNTLAEDLKNPHFKIPLWAAISHRLRRIYVWLFSVTLILWLGKLSMHPESAYSFSELVSRAAISAVPGNIVFIIVILFYVNSIFIALIGKSFDHDRKSKIESDEEMREEWQEKM